MMVYWNLVNVLCTIILERRTKAAMSLNVCTDGNSTIQPSRHPLLLT